MQFLRKRGRISGIADRDGGDGLTVDWNFKYLFGLGVIKAGHLVDEETSRGGFDA